MAKTLLVEQTQHVNIAAIYAHAVFGRMLNGIMFVQYAEKTISTIASRVNTVHGSALVKH